MKHSLLFIAFLLVPTLFLNHVDAVELLTDGKFEFAATVPGWDLQESIYDQTSMMPRNIGNLNSAEQRTFGPHSGAYALWLRAFVGGEDVGPDTLSNAVLSQTVPANAGEIYTFSGHSRWELNYSGAAATLFDGPLGPVASPTETTLELAFLNSTGSVIGTPKTLDLRTEQNNFDFWLQHTLMDTAPAGASQVRVTAAAEQMLWNGGGSESAFFDTFSLQSDAAIDTELLVNPDLDFVPTQGAAEDPQIPFDPAWMITEVRGGNIPTDATVLTAGFANRPDSGGQLGAWLKSFTGNSTDPADAILTQTVPGLPGGDYTFSAWSNFQENYSGGISTFNTETIMELAFLDGTGAEIGTPLMLDIAAEQMSDETWRQHTLNGAAPAGTASVRVMAAGLDMETNPNGGRQSAFFDDFSLDGPVVGGLACDFNADSSCDSTDIDMLYGNFGGDVAFDVNGDSAVNDADIAAWLSSASDPANLYLGGTKTFLLGDVNLDGSVDSSDLGLMLNNFGNTGGLLFGAGNLTDDSNVDSGDLGLLLNNFNFISSAAAAAVPEPIWHPLWALLLWGMTIKSRRKP